MRSHPIATAVVTLSATALALAAAPAAWIVAGSAPGDYEFDANNLSIAAKPDASEYGFGTLMQKVDAGTYRGSRWRLSARMRTSEAHHAQMWMRVDGQDDKVLGFDNMGSRPVSGTTRWKAYDIVLDVPADSAAIAFGFFLNGSGAVWAEDFQMVKVDDSVAVTGKPVERVITPK